MWQDRPFGFHVRRSWSKEEEYLDKEMTQLGNELSRVVTDFTST